MLFRSGHDTIINSQHSCDADQDTHGEEHPDCHFLSSRHLQIPEHEYRHEADDQIIRDMVFEKICSKYLIMSIQRSSIDPEKTFIRLNQLITNIPKDWIKDNGQIQNQFNTLFQQILEQKSYSEEWRQKLAALRHNITF